MTGPVRPARRHTGWRRIGAAGAVSLIVAVTLAGLAQVRVDTGIESFLPSDDPAQRALEEKARSFGGDPVVVLLESDQPRELLHGDQLSRLLRLEGMLAKLPDVAEVYGPGTSLNQIAIGAQNLIAQISGRRDALQSAARQAHESGDVAGARLADEAVNDFDLRYGSLLVGALPAGLPTLSNPRFVDTAVFGGPDVSAQARPEWRAVVPTPTAVAVLVRPRDGLDQAATAQLVTAVRGTIGRADLHPARVTVSGVPAVTAALTERAQGEFPLLGGVALVAVGLLYLIVPWTRRRRDRLRPLAVALAATAVTLAGFGWTGRPLSLGVVAFLPILLGIGSDYPLYLAQPTQRRRVLVAALAGLLAFASLTVSRLPFVRELGIALAAGMFATVAIALLLRRWVDVRPSERLDAVEPRRHSPWLRLAAFTVAAALAAAGWAALPTLTVEANPERLAEGLPALEDANYTEGVLGAAGEINLVLRGPNILAPEALTWTRQAEDLVVRDFGDRLHPITTVSDLLAFLGTDPTPQQIQAGVDMLPTYLSSAVVTPDRTVSLTVLGVELQDLREQKAMLDSLRASLPAPPAGYQVDVVGLPVAAASAYAVVHNDRVWVNVVALALAAMVLLVGLRERRDAIAAALTVVFSGGWVLGATWLTTGTLSPLTMAVAALTTATGCEFAVMLAEARRGRRPWLLRSVLLATSAAAVGYLALALSDLAILREFGLLLASGVVVSCLAALLVVGVVLPTRVLARAEPTEPAVRDRPLGEASSTIHDHEEEVVV